MASSFRRSNWSLQSVKDSAKDLIPFAVRRRLSFRKKRSTKKKEKYGLDKKSRSFNSFSRSLEDPDDLGPRVQVGPYQEDIRNLCKRSMDELSQVYLFLFCSFFHFFFFDLGGSRCPGREFM